MVGIVSVLVGLFLVCLGIAAWPWPGSTVLDPIFDMIWSGGLMVIGAVMIYAFLIELKQDCYE